MAPDAPENNEHASDVAGAGLEVGVGAVGDQEPTEALPSPAVLPSAHAERLADLEAKVARAVTRSRAPATLRAYHSDWRDFTLWCETIGASALPATPSVVAAYLAERAEPPDDRRPAAVSTLTRRMAAIGEGHRAAGHPNPCADELVRTTMAGLR
ncbi:MAG: site-specific integrase, partial [Gemmatimonadaceae bacterium]|nr:site-specific integrase [Gemmatimonadaceae bacterium]